MSDSSHLTITLPDEMAALVKAKVESGEYASESAVIYDGLLALRARDEAPDAAYDQALEAWLRTEAVASYDEHVADPSGGIPIEEVLARARARYRERAAKPGR